MIEKEFMKGNEAIGLSAIKSKLDFLCSYPITPSTELTEYIAQKHPDKFFQTASEVETGNLLMGLSATGAKVMTATSGCGLSLMSESLSYLVMSQLPCVVVDVMRMGPGLGNITPGTQDISICYGAGHGMSQLIGLTPTTIQELYDFVPIAFELAFKHRIPVMIMYDAILGQMWEQFIPHDFEVNIDETSWNINGKDIRKITSFATSDEKQKEMVETIINKWEWENIPYSVLKYDSLLPEYLYIPNKPILSAIGLTARTIKKAAELCGCGYYIPKVINPLIYPNELESSEIVTIEIGGYQLAQIFQLNGLKIRNTEIFTHYIPSIEELVERLES